MVFSKRSVTGVMAVGALVTVLAACGSSSSSKAASPGTTVAAAKSGGTITVAMGTAPDSLDPQFGYTTQAAEADWISYTPLLTYAHANGEAGTVLIPGLATALPTVSADGLTYNLTLRSGLTYSNGAAVKASDFAYTIERAIKINWGGKSFFTDYVVGAADYDAGKATSISGITTDDATGAITIKLLSAYGAFANVLAFPSAGLVPTGTPMTAESNDPPPGVGPYMITKVTPNVSFTVQKNPKFAAFNIPGIPVGSLDTINVTVESNPQTEAEQVLSNQVDVFDAGDTVPPTLLSQIQSQASTRFAKEPSPSTFYFFFNVTQKPFNNPIARQAVNLALDRTALQRLASGFLTPGCYFLPPSIIGHPTAACPYGDPTQPPSAANVAKAKQMITQAGLAGTPVTIYSETRSPRQQYSEYYQSVLTSIGFNATLKVIQDSVYFQTIGNQSTEPQTGFADWIQDFPNPSDFYLLLDGRSIQPQNSENYGNVNDPHIQSELIKLNAVPATQLQASGAEWQALDEYVAKQAYVAVYGSEVVPKFFSNRIDFASAVFSPLYFNDWSSLKLK